MSEIIVRTHPGTIVKKSIEALNMSSKEFSYRTGISERTLSDLVNLKGSITFDIAEKLSSFFDNDIQLWVNLQTQYNYYLSQLNYKKEIEADFKCIKPSLTYLKSILYINDNDNPETIVKKVRSTIKVNKLTLLNDVNSFVSLKEIRTLKPNRNFEKNLWISLALTLARDNQVSSYDKEKLINYLPEIRSMTVQEPKVFCPRLFDIMSECGISFVLMPYLPKSNIYGATKWLSSNSVMVSLSNRGNRADSFWFAFFHEIAHVMLEHKRYMLLNADDIADEEADEFAKNSLISLKDWDAFIYRNNFSANSIRRFAKEINILPQIVLGRLEKENYLDYGVYDKYFAKNYKIQCKY